jgi:hypothetical protein
MVLDSSGAVLRTFNEVGALIWASLPNDRDSIVHLLQEAFPDVPADVLAQDLDRFLTELGATGLIASTDD